MIDGKRAAEGFVVRRRDRLVAVEVKATPLRRPAISRAARSFISAYRPACLALVNAALSDTIEVDGIPMHMVRPWELDTALAALEG